jgi:ABC-type lipoprotein release transport system permease subunit
MLLSLACVVVSIFAALIPANAAANVSPAEILKEQ